MSTANSILASVRDVIGEPADTVLLHRPYLPPRAAELLQECVDTGWVSSAGTLVTKFESLLAEVTGAKRAVATVNGTTALEVCLKLAGVKPGDEVLAPSLSFVATANAISHLGAIPHFVDVSFDRLSICPDSLKSHLQSITKMGVSGSIINRFTGNRISAICLMHCFGHPGDLDSIIDVSNHYGITLVEDAAESLGSFYKGKHTGRFSRLAALSFNGNKIITTGGGGAILTDDDEVADRAKHLTSTAKIPHAWEFRHDEIAWNYRMPNINAALGVSQLEIFDSLLAAKRTLAMRYKSSFSALKDALFIDEPTDSFSNFWLNAFRVCNADINLRNELLQLLNSANYQCRPIWEPMHFLDIYSSCPRAELPRTEQLRAEIINIPSSPDLVLHPN